MMIAWYYYAYILCVQYNVFVEEKDDYFLSDTTSD